jgi:predicted PurR-regulated permease PerM
VLRVGRGIIGGVIGGIFNFFMTLMVSAYLLVTEARVLGFFRSLVPPESRERLRQPAAPPRPRALRAWCAGSSSSASSTAR